MGEISGVLQSGGTTQVGDLRSLTFSGCHVLAASDPRDRTRLRDGRVEGCRHDGCWVSGAVLEDLTITDLRGIGRLGAWLRGCVFSRVVFRGRISGVTWQREVSDDPALNETYERDAIQRYEAIPVALDISAATFPDLTVLNGIPPSLVRLNVEQHFVLPKDRAKEVRSASTTLLVVSKMASDSAQGVVFPQATNRTGTSAEWKNASSCGTRGCWSSRGDVA